VALLTSTEAKAIKPDLKGTAQDTLIDTLIGRADEVLAAHCGFRVYDSSVIASVTRQTYTIYLDGPTWEDQQVLALPVFPIGTIASVYDDPTDRAYASGSLVAASDYETDDDRGLVLLKQSSVQGYWSRGFRAQKVTLTAGWATTPGALKHAGAELVWHWYRLMRERGHDSISIGGASAATWPGTVPQFIVDMVRPFRLPGALL
jgi:hypothetical protein